MRLKVYFILPVFLIGVKVIAQTDTSISQKGIQAKLHYGFIFAHSQHVQNTAGSHPLGLEIEFIKQRMDTAAWKLCNCYPTTGLSLSYFNFNNAVLGHGFSIAYFLEPSYRISKRAQFRFRGNIGISYNTNPYHTQRNPANMSYSTQLNGFAQVGLSGAYQVGSRWLIF